MLFSAMAVTCLLVADSPGAPDLPKLLSRVAEESAVFQQNMPKALTQEVLEQRAALPPSRFRPRAGSGTPPATQGRFQVREIVSEYSVGALKDSASHDLVEFRQVISVDGRAVQTPAMARHALSLGMQAQDDRVRKRMLEDFARNGLVDIATDYGLILLAFSTRAMEDMDIALRGEAQLGAETAALLSWKQRSATGGELEFHGRQAARHPLEGILWLRKSDGLPLRVEVWVQYTDQARHTIRDQATIEYVQSTHGFLTPISVVHRHVVDGRLLTENLYRYDPFKLFSADTEIKFTELPDATPPAAAVKK